MRAELGGLTLSGLVNKVHAVAEAAQKALLEQLQNEVAPNAGLASQVSEMQRAVRTVQRLVDELRDRVGEHATELDASAAHASEGAHRTRAFLSHELARLRALLAGSKDKRTQARTAREAAVPPCRIFTPLDMVLRCPFVFATCVATCCVVACPAVSGTMRGRRAATLPVRIAAAPPTELTAGYRYGIHVCVCVCTCAQRISRRRTRTGS